MAILVVYLRIVDYIPCSIQSSHVEYSAVRMTEDGSSRTIYYIFIIELKLVQLRC